MNPTSVSTKRRVIFGATVWVLAIQYFISEYIVAKAWGNSYSFRYNFISDLGATGCHIFPLSMNEFVCSPLHGLMNTSFFINGIIILVGLFLIRQVFVPHQLIRKAMTLMTLGSVGLIIVALFPEDTLMTLHLTGAGILFILTNISLVLWGIGMRKTKQWPAYAMYTLLSGIIGLIALIALPFGFVPTIGIGLTERIVAYPLTIWLIVSGIVIFSKYVYKKS